MFPLPLDEIVHGQAFRTMPACWRHRGPRSTAPGQAAYKGTSAGIRGLLKASCPPGCTGSKPPSFLSLQKGAGE